MSFDSFADFIAMGGHGFYVWFSYGISILVVLANVVVVRYRRLRYIRELADMARRQQTAEAS
ncbi:MAG: heme exporter protein CcmD [Gammaproteobacteria bacterium]|nr:heme exporter protein CcmD [Gammaproteobacteria bacterium]MCZ6855257.1 heme exporter protein CcmD [Gammaproteobacteria bacterium]